MRKINLTVLFLSIATSVMAQQQRVQSNLQQRDTLSADPMEEAALLYPRIRQFSISHLQGTSGKIKAESGGQPLYDGNYQLSRTSINMSVPVVEGKQNALIGSIGVVHQFTTISNISNYNPQLPVFETKTYIPMVSLGATFVHRDSLFNHPVTFTGVVSGLFTPDFSSRQFTFTGLISVPVIQRPFTRLTAGLVVNIDPSSPIPAFLLVSYFHKFRSMDMDLMVDAPYRIALRKAIKKRSSLTVQTEVGGNNSFFEFNTPNLPQKLTFSTLEIKSGVLFEYRVTKKMIFSLSGGALSTVTSKIFAQGEKPDNYLVKNKQATVPYAQVGISLLPFWQPFKKHE